MKTGKKIIVLCLSLTAVVSVFLSSCSDEPSEIKVNSSKSMNDVGVYGIYNSQNPYDSVGLKHNVLLQELGAYLIDVYGDRFYQRIDWSDTNSLSIIKSAMSSVLSNELQQRQGFYTQEEQIEFLQYAQNLNLFDSIFYDDSADNYILFNDISRMPYYDREVSQYYQEIQNALQLYLCANISINELFSRITDVENRAIAEIQVANGEFSQNGRILLTSISVMKHSIVYWNNALQSRSNAWYQTVNYLLDNDLNIDGLSLKEKENIFKKCWKSIKKFFTGTEEKKAKTNATTAAVIGGDVLGFFCGGLVGSAIASGGCAVSGTIWIAVTTK
jgi:hypothetical protein